MATEVSQFADFEAISLRKIEKDTSLSLGQYGATFKTAAGALSGGPWAAIQATVSAVVNVTAANWTGEATTAVDVVAGSVIFGDFTAINLSVGKIIAYKQSV